MNVEQLVDAFADATGIGPLSPIDGVWKFSADDHVFGVTTDESDEKLFLFAELPSPPPEREPAFRKAVLEANFFGRGTCGAVFSINPDTGAYALVLSKPLAGLLPDSFFVLVEKFVNTLASWKGILAAIQPHSEQYSKPNTPQPEPEPQEYSPDFFNLDFIRI